MCPSGQAADPFIFDSFCVGYDAIPISNKFSG